MTSIFDTPVVTWDHPRMNEAMSATELKEILSREAHALGFSSLRIAHPSGIGEAGNRLLTFLAEGRHGDMAWMQTHADRRRDPLKLWPNAKSIIVLAMNYTPAHDPLEALMDRGRGAISVYAQGRDYHDIMKSKLKQLARLLQQEGGGKVRVFVDTAPLMEKPIAAVAGTGWQGKHTNLVSRDLGSWFFLGAILSTLALALDDPEDDHCGSCRNCLDICPTKAFPAPYVLDARRCISYLTIEHKGHIGPEFRAPMGNRIYGCDDCLAVCPWNKFAETAKEAGFLPRPGSANPPLRELLQLDDAAFRARFAGTAIKRTGRDRFLRNVLIAAGNAKDKTLIPQIKVHLKDSSPLVRAMAVWALRRLETKSNIEKERIRHLAQETDPQVRQEWTNEATQ